MKLKRSVGRVLALGLAALCGATEAKAAFVQYTIGDGGLVGGFAGTIDGNIIGGNNFLAGGIHITKTSGGAGLPDSYTTICTDLGGTLFLGSTYGFSAPTQFAGQTGVAPFWGDGPGAVTPAIQNAAQLFYQYGIFGGVLAGSDSDAKAGLQLAVWEALYDTGNSVGLTVGNNPLSRFKITGGNATAIADANNYLIGLNGMYNYPGYLLIPDPVTPPGQSDPAQELLIGFGDFTPAPEPGTYAMAAGGCALFCLVAIGRKPKRCQA